METHNLDKRICAHSIREADSLGILKVASILKMPVLFVLLMINALTVAGYGQQQVTEEFLKAHRHTPKLIEPIPYRLVLKPITMATGPEECVVSCSFASLRGDCETLKLGIHDAKSLSIIGASEWQYRNPGTDTLIQTIHFKVHPGDTGSFRAMVEDCHGGLSSYMFVVAGADSVGVYYGDPRMYPKGNSVQQAQPPGMELKFDSGKEPRRPPKMTIIHSPDPPPAIIDTKEQTKKPKKPFEICVRDSAGNLVPTDSQTTRPEQEKKDTGAYDEKFWLDSLKSLEVTPLSGYDNEVVIVNGKFYGRAEGEHEFKPLESMASIRTRRQAVAEASGAEQRAIAAAMVALGVSKGDTVDNPLASSAHLVQSSKASVNLDGLVKSSADSVWIVVVPEVKLRFGDDMDQRMYDGQRVKSYKVAIDSHSMRILRIDGESDSANTMWLGKLHSSTIFDHLRKHQQTLLGTADQTSMVPLLTAVKAAKFSQTLTAPCVSFFPVNVEKDAKQTAVWLIASYGADGVLSLADNPTGVIWSTIVDGNTGKCLSTDAIGSASHEMVK